MSDRPSSGGVRWALWAFPAAVALMALCALGGRWGMYLDDWSSSARDPVTGEADWSLSPFRHYSYFWRPLLMLHWHYAHTALWNHMWVLHLLGAATHAGVSLLLYALLRRMRLSRTGASVGGLAFMLIPLAVDVIFWATAVSISQGLALVLVAALVYVGFVEGRGGWWRLPLMAGLSFAVPCLYEQPAMVILAFPLVALAAGAIRGWGGVWRSILGGVVCGVPVLAYVGLLVATAPKTSRGGAGSFIKAEELGRRLNEVAHHVGSLHTGHLEHLAGGGLVRGVQWLGSGWGGWALGAVALIAALGGVWALACVNERQGEALKREGWAWVDAPLARGGATWGVAIAIWLLAWLPVLPFRGQLVELRNTYLSNAGVAIAVAAVVNLLWLITRGGGVPSRIVRGAGASAAACGAVVGSVVMVGHQLNYQSRAKLDEDQGSQISRMMRGAPSGAVVVVLGNAKGSSCTGYSLFDHGLAPWSLASWSARGLVQFSLKRTDVEVVAHNPWIGPARLIDRFDERGFRSVNALPGAGSAHEAGGTWVEWSKAVPITVGEDGVVRAVDRLVIERADGRDIDVLPGLVHAMLGADPETPSAGYVIETNGDAPGSRRIEGWTIGERRVAPADTWAHMPYGWSRAAFRFGDDGHSPIPAALSTELDAGGWETLSFRATLDPASVRRCRGCEGVRVEVVVRDADGRSASGEVVLEPDQAVLERWWPIRVGLPAGGVRGARVELRVTRASGESGEVPVVLVTAGERLAGQPAAEASTTH